MLDPRIPIYRVWLRGLSIRLWLAGLLADDVTNVFISWPEFIPARRSVSLYVSDSVSDELEHLTMSDIWFLVISQTLFFFKQVKQHFYYTMVYFFIKAMGTDVLSHEWVFHFKRNKF